jgi:HAE1 family hydrophobic/amphiphilic exporter-1
VLFTWGQIGAAVRAAGHDRKATEHQYEAARQLALRETATAFYNLLLAIELEKVARDSVEQRRRHLDETERKYHLEVATDFDVLAARVSLTNAQPTLTQAENSIRITKDRLRYYTGLQGEFDISGSLHSTLNSSYSVDEVIETAKAKRPEVAFYYSRVGAFEELVKVVKGGNKPRVDLRGNLGWSSFRGSGFDIPEGERWDLGIFFTYPFFDGLRTKGRVIQAEAQRNITELELKRLFDNIALEARGAINRLYEAIEIVKGLEATSLQAERLLAMAEDGYRHGVKTKLEVDDAELNLTTARSNLAQARREYLLARTFLFWIMGEDLLDALTNNI